MTAELSKSHSVSAAEVVCIVGMHRSGTSLITQLLKQSGLYLGAEENLLGSNQGNPDGHFEHVEFIAINNAILTHLGGSWELPPELSPGWEQAASLEPLRCRARELLQGFARHSPWGWKDPRTSLLLPFWRSLIADLRIVICVRSPLAVVHSLQTRDKTAPTRGAYLWHRYLHAALVDSVGCRRLVVFYDDYFDNRQREAAALLEFCGLPLGGVPVALAATIRDDLRRQPHDMAALLACEFIPRESKLLYLALRGLAGKGGDGLARQGGPHDSFSELLQLLEDSAQFELLAHMQSTLNRSESELANLRAEMWRDAKANHRLAYRIYRKILRPFQLARLRRSR